MIDSSLIDDYVRQFVPPGTPVEFARFLPREAKVAAVEAALHSPAAKKVRAEAGRWIVETFVPVESLVPENYAQWRPPVRDCMLFVVNHLSEARLAPKIIEQLELPTDTPPEVRLLKLIERVPGLQKLGQVLARNRHLRPSMRTALSKLENGIRDMEAEESRKLIERELGERVQKFDVRIDPAILSEASVSVVMRFTWRDPESGRRERGVFKVLKPHIPVCFAEDMDILHDLAQHFGTRHGEYGFAANVLTDTFNKVRRLLEHEVDFVREQKTLLGRCSLYRAIKGVRVPHLIPTLCTPQLTAMSEEPGIKVTNAVSRMPDWGRTRVAEQLIQTLMAAPLFATEEDVIFHADPHAGNLLYDNRTGELTMLDWALTERLTRDQRRHLALMVFMVGLRDSTGACNEIFALTQSRIPRRSRRAKLICDTVAEFIDEMPFTHLPGAVDAMKLLERIAMSGIRFPAPLIMFSKSVFTLDGVLQDVGGTGVSISFVMARQLVRRWLSSRASFGAPLTMQDWIGVQCSAMFYAGRLFIRGEQALLDRLLPPATAELETA